ncbi:uncharacterized protein BDZ83DRAFT_103013 [Colletotrichum acutatum]|uniref:Uncharacterized protein n=1 Tax=Glomerella acutata TaxID=27357 RepID=A0AAD8XK45_GLOAC|nr:uncharacterized protein BDZ83DRAFT_103013 [Colletotrichum acutatum]KAK1728818.1 hypothetical protein BDZ83DRAFT_103013 [Colletotrichum acutatum]
MNIRYGVVANMMPSHLSERLGIAPSSILGFGILLPFSRTMLLLSVILTYFSSSCCQLDIILLLFARMSVFFFVGAALPLCDALALSYNAGYVRS